MKIHLLNIVAHYSLWQFSFVVLSADMYTGDDHGKC